MLLQPSRIENCPAGEPEPPRQDSPSQIRGVFANVTSIQPNAPVISETDMPSLPVISTSIMHLKELAGKGPDREFWVTARLGTNHAAGTRLHILLEVQEDGRTVKGREVSYTDHFVRMGYKYR